MTGEGISAQAKDSAAGFDVWVIDEDQLDKAKAYLEEFVANPDAPKFSEGVKKARAVRREERERRERVRQRVSVGDQNFTRRTPVTFICLGICVVLSLMTDFDLANLATMKPAAQMGWFNFVPFEDAVEAGYISDPAEIEAAASAPINGSWELRVGSLLHGEVWRIVGPAFLHYDLRHLIFNMLVLVAFGRRIEWLEGRAFMVGLILAGAAIPNLLQGLIPLDWDGSGVVLVHVASAGGNYFLTPFAGFSGVDYALVTFILLRGMTKFVPEYQLSGFTVMLIFGWFLLGVSGADQALQMNMANWAHGGGILVGWVAAYLPLGRTSRL